jgi:hypothetical protein
MSEYKEIFDSNIQRIDSLVALYSQIKSTSMSDKNKEFKFTDMLRAAVVFMHSSFEEYFRNVLTKWMPTRGSRDALKNISLPKDAGKNGVKYTLYDFLEFKDKTVSEIFRDSVIEHMSRASFNNYTEICSWGKKIGLSFDSFKCATDLDKAINRRHKIVHEADMTEKQIRPIKEPSVTLWKESYEQLVDIIETQINVWATAESQEGQSDEQDCNKELCNPGSCAADRSCETESI